MDFIPKNTDEEKEMLKETGVGSIKGLFSDIPEKIQLKKSLNPGKALPEAELKRKIEGIASKNKKYKTSFLGAGSYPHYIPAVVTHIVSRSEFYTAYTPYQAEMSQGILQAIFEYQTMICELTGMDVANASLYDGAEALAEAAGICINKTGRSEVIISKAVHPEYRETVRTYLDARDKKLVEVDFSPDGKTDFEKLREEINGNTAGVLIQSPNFFGIIEDVKRIAGICRSNNSIFAVCAADPTCLGILKSPGELGADIFAGEGQSFGNPKSFGGPYLGIMAVKEELMRDIPGRLVGQTADKEGKKGYILTLQAREQHIRREKATCNICSNEALNALTATVYLASLGKNGIKELGNLNLQKANYLKGQLENLGVKIKFNGYCYNEFAAEFNDEKEMNSVINELEKNNIEAGLKLYNFYPELKNCMLFCATEMNSKQEIDELINVIKKIKSG
jgi:glycine dehydrogenase subunit 1